MTHHFARVAAAVVLTGAIAGCSDGTSRTVTRSVEVGSAKSVDVDLGFGAGELRVSGGARALLDARFEISGDDPAVDYAVNNGEGRLRVGPSKSSSGIGGGAGEWDLQLQNGVPMNLKVSTGAGETHLDLGMLDLQKLDSAGTVVARQDTTVGARTAIASNLFPLKRLGHDDGGHRKNLALGYLWRTVSRASSRE